MDREKIIKGTFTYQWMELARCMRIFLGHVFKGLYARGLAKHYFDQARQIKRHQFEMLDWGKL